MNSLPNCTRALLAAFTLLVAASWAQAQTTITTEYVTARLVSEQAVVQPGQRVAVMLHQRIRPHWHTYWRNPGDSGQATQINWQLPEGARAEGIEWPTPSALQVGPLVNYGYSDSVGLISQVMVPANWPVGQAFPIKADATWLVCDKECIPEDGHFELLLPTAARSAVAVSESALFSTARSSQPVASPWQARLSGDAEWVTLHLGVPGADANRIVEAHYFPAEWGVIDHAAEQILRVTESGLSLKVRKGDLPTPKALDGIVTLAENTGDRVVRSAFRIDAQTTPVASAAQPTMPVSVWVILLSALAGGLLLNLMPCVFPILAMKALAFVSHATAPTRERLIGGVAYTAGVLLSFAALGGLLLALKAGGSAVGWGFQLQNPILVALLAYVLFAAGLNLSGVFDIGGRFMGMGSKLTTRSGVSGSFFTGVLAAVVATPCTAPFMATAIGVAMTQPPLIAMSTFVMLGLGLALPYLALTMFPVVARALPKPGAWMNTLKQALAFPLYASAAWLVWVLAQQTDANGVFVALLGMIAIALAIWLWQLPTRRPVAQVLRLASFAVVLLGSVALTLSLRSTRGEVQSIARNELSQPFVKARFDDLRAEGKPVFVNLTAAWCITCKVNERVALSGEAFRAALQAGGYTYLKGDWTNQNPVITQLLESFGRAGVPLYVVYPANSQQGTVLPQMLTESMVVDALQGNVSSDSST